MKDKKLLKEYLKKLVNGKMTLKQVATATGYSVRQVWNLKERFQNEGESCLVHKNTNKPSVRRIPEETRLKIVNLYMAEFEGYNFSFFNEILEQDYGIKISYKTLYNIMKEKKINSPEKHKIKKIEKHHRIRPRRQNEGEMLQIDGTPYQWFAWCGDMNYYCIQAGVDDATSKMVAMYMTENECLYGYMEMLRQCYKRHGSPKDIYSDRAAIFCVTPRQKDKLSIIEQLEGLHEKRTQWQRILEEMHINQILAWSPQAKGRVERMWHTVQDRLPYYFRKYKIKTIEAANQFLENEFIDIYNKKFGRTPADDDSFYVRLNDDNIDQILCARFPCKTDVNGQFKFQRLTFAIVGAKYSSCRKIELCVTDKGLSACMNGLYYPVQLLDQLTDGNDELMPIVVRNIIHNSLMKDMKKVSA